MNKLRIPHFKKKDIPNFLMIIVSAIVYTFGYVLFIRSGNLFPGGVTGISRLVSLEFNVSFSLIYFLLNAIITIVVFKNIGPKFLVYSVLWYTLTSILISLIELPTITEDLLLIAVFGGIVCGFASVLALRANGSGGGTDFIAIDLAARFNKPSWNYILALNVCVLLIAGFRFGWNTALYSMIFQFVSTQVVNTFHHRYTSSRIQVVTDRPDDIAAGIFEICDHGITIVPCEGAWSHSKHSILLMTVNTYQVKAVEKKIIEIDPKAFLTIDTVKRVVGNYHQEPLE